ncbi:protein lin-37 homolog [Cynoglossus semilaevis]|uniref:protein lin-37 homolog n=1 Tax=Cynoglossus semilaevis TaxID=244447 RepID=UPI000D62CEF0|nr:protein lin-37 homolog [Cynoglossus semilaevis]
MHHVKIKSERSDMEMIGARNRLDAVLKGLVEKSENEREQNDGDAGKSLSESLTKDLSPSSAGKRPSSRFSQHRRKKRKEMDEGIPETNQHKQNAYVIKLFDRSVDLAQFHTGTPLYPICRAWMRNNPSVREPARSPSPPHNVVEEEVTDMINGKNQNVYRLPPPTPCPVSNSGELINLRIPPTDKPTVTKSTESVSGSLLCDHMDRWKKIRQKYGSCFSRISDILYCYFFLIMCNYLFLINFFFTVL